MGHFITGPLKPGQAQFDPPGRAFAQGPEKPEQLHLGPLARHFDKSLRNQSGSILALGGHWDRSPTDQNKLNPLEGHLNRALRSQSKLEVILAVWQTAMSHEHLPQPEDLALAPPDGGCRPTIGKCAHMLEQAGMFGSCIAALLHAFGSFA